MIPHKPALTQEDALQQVLHEFFLDLVNLLRNRGYGAYHGGLVWIVELG